MEGCLYVIPARCGVPLALFDRRKFVIACKLELFYLLLVSSRVWVSPVASLAEVYEVDHIRVCFANQNIL